MSAKPPIPPGLRAALWGLGIASLGMGLALVATIDMFQRERAAGERMRMASQPLIDSLRAEVRRSHLADPRGAGGPDTASSAIEGISRRQVEGLRSAGLADPVSDLKTDLARHPELIPIPGGLGGTMGFYHRDRIWILNGRWAFADFDDGHFEGSMLLEYRVENGAITWRRIASTAP